MIIMIKNLKVKPVVLIDNITEVSMQRRIKCKGVGDVYVGKHVDGVDAAINQYVRSVAWKLVGEIADVLKRRPRHATVVKHKPAIRKAVLSKTGISTLKRCCTGWLNGVPGVTEIMPGIGRRSRMHDHSNKSVCLLIKSTSSRFRICGSHRDAKR